MYTLLLLKVLYCSILIIALHRLAVASHTMPSRRLKRYSSDSTTTKVSVNVCVGNHYITTEKHYDGEIEATVFDLSYEQGLTAIKSAIGYGRKHLCQMAMWQAR